MVRRPRQQPSNHEEPRYGRGNFHAHRTFALRGSLRSHLRMKDLRSDPKRSELYWVGMSSSPRQTKRAPREAPFALTRRAPHQSDRTVSSV